MLCLCRLLLAAVAVSCTLSRIHANGPSTQRSDRIKDLMCVLLLSGMQKDDLDENVLNKLQRHNVNIHDLNDKDLLRECTTYRYLNYENTTPYINTSVTKNSINNLTTNIKDGNINNLSNNNVKNDDKFNKREDKYKKKEDEIKYVDSQPELKSVLNFWKDIKIDNTSKTTESPLKINTMNDVVNKNHRPEQKNKRNVPDASNSNESDVIQKLLVNILLKNQNINKPAKKTLENGDDNDVYLFGTRNENKNTGNNEKYKAAGMAPAEMSPLKVMAMPIKQYSLINSLSKNDWQLKIPEGNSDRNKPRPINTNKFNDILNALESYYPIKSRDKSVENLNVNNEEIENTYINKFSNREQSSTTEKNYKITEQKLSQNIIKEIANSVKELILNDLRKEMFQTTASYTTTERPYNTKIITTGREFVAPAVKIENPHVEQTILNKFMELFQEIKTLNHKTLITSSENKKDNLLKEEVMHYTYPGVVPILNNRMVSQSNYNTKQYIDSKTKKIYNFSQQVHKYRSNSSASIIESPKKRVLPITFQTNNMEIPPLGIPVDKPENPINQNIIVSTMRPYRIGESGVDDDKIISNSRNNYIPKKSEIRILKSHEPNLYDLNNRERVPLHRYKQPVHRGNGVKIGTRPRFHEKLERERDYFDNTKPIEYTNRVDCCDERYAYSKQMVDCCNRKIASRQQMSLSHMKKLPSYDDTHFNNFLKSQKKVTDMLERILASRSRIRSVETV